MKEYQNKHDFVAGRHLNSPAMNVQYSNYLRQHTQPYYAPQQQGQIYHLQSPPPHVHHRPLQHQHLQHQHHHQLPAHQYMQHPNQIYMQRQQIQHHFNPINEFKGNVLDFNASLFYSFLHSHIHINRLKGVLSIRKQYILANWLFEKWLWVKKSKSQQKLLNYIQTNGIHLNPNIIGNISIDEKREHHLRIINIIHAFLPRMQLFKKLQLSEQLQIREFIQFHEGIIAQDEQTITKLIHEELKLDKNTEHLAIAILKSIPKLVEIAEKEINISTKIIGHHQNYDEITSVVPFVLDYLEYGIPSFLLPKMY
mmetsp:Transcript_5358/g.7898  ORF Transcript_5358/g.7898 Transcript_5358/m.7898 type:complete len:310 (+) Transcript_5358:132-1061(+)